MQRRFLQLVIVCITLSLNGMDNPIGFDAFGNPVYLTQDQNGLVYPAAYYPVEVPIYVQPIYYGFLSSGGEQHHSAGAQSAAAASQYQSEDVSELTDSVRGMALSDDDTDTQLSEQDSDSIRLGRRASPRRMRSRSVGPCMEPHTLLRLREGIVEKKQSASVSDNDEDDTAETPAACSQASDVDSEHTVPDTDNDEDDAAATIVSSASCVDSRQTSFEAPASQPSAESKPQQPLTMDEKLSAALQDLSSLDQVQALTHSKVSWIARRDNARFRQKEWDKLLALFQSSDSLGKLHNCVDTPQDAMLLFEMGHLLIKGAHKIGDQERPIRRKFARLGRSWVLCAQRSNKIPSHLMEKVTAVLAQAEKFVPVNSHRAQDQTHIPAEQFYADVCAGAVSGQNAREVMASAIPVHESRFSVLYECDEDGDDGIEAKRVAKVNVQKKTPSRLHKEEKRSGVPQAAQQNKLSCESNYERLMRLMKGTDEQVIEAFVLLEKIADETIEEEKTIKIFAARTITSYYARGTVTEQSKKIVTQKDLGRAKHFAQQAIKFGSIAAYGDMAQIEFEEGNKAAAQKWIHRLCAHEHVPQPLMDFGRCFSAIIDFMEDENSGPSLLQTFQGVHKNHGHSNSMGQLADMLPLPFFDCMSSCMQTWQKEVLQDGEASNMSKQDKATWLYLIGRMVHEAKHARFSLMKHDAIGWIKAAADADNWHAQVFLSKCTDSPINARRRMLYLERAMATPNSFTEDEKKVPMQLLDEYLFDGFLYPLSLVLCTMNKANKLDEVISALEKTFPSMQIGRHDGEAYRQVRDMGALVGLRERAKKSWAAKGALAALEIAYIRDGKALIKDSVSEKMAEVMVQVAIKRLEQEGDAHPELIPLIVAGYSTLAYAQSAAVLKSDKDDREKKAILKEVAKNFQYAIEQGDLYAKYTYAHLLIRRPELVPEENARKVAMQYLDELAQSESDYTQHALDDLAFYLAREGHTRAAEYLERAKKHAEDTFALSSERVGQYAHVQACLQMPARARNKRLTTMKNIRKQKGEQKQKRAVQEKEKQRRDNFVILKNKERIVRAQHAAQQIAIAYTCARTNPEAALDSFIQAAMLGVAQILPGNPHLIAEYHMAVDEIRAAVDDPDVVSADKKDALLEQLAPFAKQIAHAESAYRVARDKPDYQSNPLESIVEQYLEAHRAYTIMKGIAIMRNTEAQLIAARDLLDKIPGTDRLKEALAKVSPAEFITALNDAVAQHLEDVCKLYNDAFSGQKRLLNITMKTYEELTS